MPQHPSKNKALSDAEIDRLAEQGFREGDIVPGKGRLTPQGTFKKVENDPQRQSGQTSNFERQFPNSTISRTEAQSSLDAIRKQAEQIQETINKRADEVSKREEKPAQESGDFVSSSESARQEESNMQDMISNMEAGLESDDPVQNQMNQYMEQLKARQESLDERAQSEFQFIEQRFDRAREDLEESQAEERGTQRVSLARMGGFLGPSASAQGVLVDLAEDHRSEIAALEAKRVQAIREARSGFADKSFETTKEMINLAQETQKQIQQRRQDFFDQTLDVIKEQRQQRETQSTIQNRVRDDARSALNNIVSKFGGIPVEQLPEDVRVQLEDMAAAANMPLSMLAQPTISQQKEQRQAQQDQISNAIRMANLRVRQNSFRMSQAKFAQDQQLSSMEAQRLGLPRSLVGMSEQDVLGTLQSDQVPRWFVEMKAQSDPRILESSADPSLFTGDDMFVGSQLKEKMTISMEDIQSEWNKFRQESVSDDSFQLINIGGGGGSAAGFEDNFAN